jgi:hypothetical protein
MTLRTPLLAATLALAACAPDDGLRRLRLPVTAVCSVTVEGKGAKDVEGDYLPHVVACENGGADTEALKAQAVAARTYMYYKVATSGSVKDGTSDQVYTCANAPAQKHYDAVKATSGQVLVWSGVVICSFFVAGAKPSTASCVAASGDPDPTNTEKYVTYNEGKSGSGITQSTLGWVSSTNKYNRGCLSQNGSHCLSLKGRPYPEMMRFYYGDDIQLTTANGSCVTPPPADLAVPPTDLGVDAPAVRDQSAPRVEGSVTAPDRTPSRRDLGVNPSEDLPPTVPEPGPGEEWLAGGCSLARGAVPGWPSALVLLLAAFARRRLRLRD